MDLVREYLQILPIEHGTITGELRRKATNLARIIGFDDIKSEETAIIVSEMLTNVQQHGGGTGVFFLSKIAKENFQGIELCCCDFGEGISEKSKVLVDGFSAGRSLGIGLGAIERLSDEFEINPDFLPEYVTTNLPCYVSFGACIIARKWRSEIRWIRSNPRLAFGSASRPKPGEIFNGDGYLITHQTENVCLAAVIDGLGHGTEAHQAAEMAKERIYTRTSLPLDALMNQIHLALQGTRGATVALVRLDTEARKLSFAGIGNIETRLISENKKQSLLSLNGTVGHKMRKVRLFEYAFQPGDSVLMFSDGIASHLQASYANWQQEPQLIANEMINEFSKISDDATVLIARYTS